MAKCISELSFYPWIGADYISYSTLLREMLWKSDMIITSNAVMWLEAWSSFVPVVWNTEMTTLALISCVLGLCRTLCCTLCTMHVCVLLWLDTLRAIILFMLQIESDTQRSIPTKIIQPWIPEPGFDPAGLQGDNQTVQYRLLPDRAGWPPRIEDSPCKLHRSACMW